METDIDLSVATIEAPRSEEQAIDDMMGERPAVREPAFSRQHELWCAATTHDCWPCGRAVMSTAEDIRHADALRAHLRERYLRMPKSPPTPWCVNVD